MTAPHDLDRQLRAFLTDGPIELPDPSFDAVRDRIETTQQRVVIGPWRMPTVNKIIPFVIGAAAMVVVAIGAQMLGDPAPGGVGSAPSPSPSQTVTLPPSSAPSPTPAPTPLGEALLPEGPHLLWDPAAPDQGDGLPTTVVIPASGWYGEPGGRLILKDEDPDPPTGAGIIGPWFEPLYVFGDPCSWSTTTPDDPAETVTDLMAALAAQALRDASAVTDIVIDGHPGNAITLVVPDDADFSACDQGMFGSWTVGPGLEPYRYHQGPGQIDEIWAVDIDGRLLVMDAAYYEGTPPSVVDEIRTIMESTTFEVGGGF